MLALLTEMIENFTRGGAAISVVAKELGAKLEVVDLGTVVEAAELDGVISNRIAAGTALQASICLRRWRRDRRLW